MLHTETVAEVLQRSKALAALELVLSPDWEYRWYSFQKDWAPGVEQMACMRDGCGNEWWMVFHRDGWAAVKGYAEESDAWTKHGAALAKALQAAMPEPLREFAHEAAFNWEQASFAYYRLPGDAAWTHVNQQTEFAGADGGEPAMLQHILGTAAHYAEFAKDYHEVAVEVSVVEGVFALQPFTEATVQALNPDLTLEIVSEALAEEIGYPVG